MAAESNGHVTEMIGRAVVGAPLKRSRWATESIDRTVPNYAFWDMLRRCQMSGYYLGGLFARRIERVIASWVLGAGVDITLRDTEGIDPDALAYTNAALADYVGSLLDAGQDEEDDTSEQVDGDAPNASLLTMVLEDAIGLGDQYVFVNPDGSQSIPSPDTVDVKRDPLDYRRVLSVTITTRTGGATIIDEYRADGRTVTTKRAPEGKEQTTVEQYENLLGRIPFVHIAFGRTGNETNGHPIHEALLPLYDQYDDLIFKQLDGAKKFGSPIPVFGGLEDLTAVQNANAPATTSTYIDKDGAEVTRPELMLDGSAAILLGKGAAISYLTPPVGFTEDTKTALKSLFLLLLDHTGIPESIWGGELSSARASSDTQMTQFIREVQGWQRNQGGWILRLCKIWLQTKALLDPGLIVGRLRLSWPELEGEDRVLLLQFLTFAKDRGLLTDATALTLSQLVDNPQEEVEDAATETEEKMQKAFPDGTTGDFNSRLNQDATAGPLGGQGGDTGGPA